jgi:hypothetical protein
MIGLFNGFDIYFQGHSMYKVYDLTTKSEYGLPYEDTNPQVISNVVGYLVRQFDTSYCDAILISNADKKMYICR